jgi:endo-1,4-beta-xylanase
MVGGLTNPTFADNELSSLPSLKQIAGPKNIQICSAYNVWDNPRLKQLLVLQCDVITPENELKAAEISSDDRRDYNPGKMDEIAEFCRRNALGVHGHALYWNQSLPGWLAKNNLKQAIRAHERHLQYVMTRYPKTQSWDVVNEPISDHRKGYRENTILEANGDAFLQFMFRRARELAPQAKLVVNDYNLSCGADFCETKRSSMLRVLERLLAAGAPIDALGIQGHLVPRWPVVPKRILTFLQEVADLGLEIYISELDVNDIDLPKDIAARDQLIAQIYRDYLDAVLTQKNVKRIGFWGLTDRFHWIVEGYAPFNRKNGAPRPALFDEDLEPKPAFFAVADALRAASAR